MKTAKYSSLLQEFIAPLLIKNESDDAFMTKMKIAEIIWNYCIAREFRLPVFDELHKIITDQNKNHPEMKQVFDLFTKIKETDFGQYKNFITKTEYRIKPTGAKTLYVESVEPKYLY